MPDKDNTKIQKKLAKAQIKAGKKGQLPEDLPVRQDYHAFNDTEEDRSIKIAEKELALHRWKVIFAAVSALIALISLIVLLLNS